MGRRHLGLTWVDWFKGIMMSFHGLEDSMDTVWPCFLLQGVWTSGVWGAILSLCIGTKGVQGKSLIFSSVQCGKLQHLGEILAWGGDGRDRSGVQRPMDHLGQISFSLPSDFSLAKSGDWVTSMVLSRVLLSPGTSWKCVGTFFILRMTGGLPLAPSGWYQGC